MSVEAICAAIQSRNVVQFAYKKLLMAAFLFLNLGATAQRSIVFVPGDKDPCCTTVYIEGKAYRSISDGNVTVTISKPVFLDKQTLADDVAISNGGSGAVLVDPQAWSMFLVGQDGPVAGLDGDAFVQAADRKARRGVMIAAMMGGMAAGVSQQQATVYNSDGSVSTVTYHDPQADANARAQAADMRDHAHARISSMSSETLRKNTLFPGSTLTGRIYFPKPKKMKLKDTQVRGLQVQVGADTFVF